MDKKPIITFVGAGNMASSLIGGLIADHYDAKNLWGTNPALEKLEILQKCFAINVTSDNKEGVAEADIVVFSVKPAELQAVLKETAAIIRDKKPLLISVVTGIRLASMSKWLNNEAIPIVRTMPNTPCLVGCGATALFANEFVNDKQKDLAESILRSVGITLWMENEAELDTVTALSGSGPAYFFLMMEALQAGAVKLGLTQNAAKMLTIQTALGSARMALESNKELKELREQVTSKGGTTEQALKVLEKGAIRNLYYEALQAAKQRAEEMASLLK